LDILRHLVNSQYWEGLSVVAIVMGAEILKGIYFNLSFWYKLIDETKWGAYFSIVGCAVIMLMNIMLVPKYGYVASAWASVAGYGVITILSYWLGQKKYPIKYDIKGIGKYMLLAALLYAASSFIPVHNFYLRMLFHTVLLVVFLAYVTKNDMPLKQIPILNRFARK